MTANAQAMATSFKAEVLQAYHALGPANTRATNAPDTLLAALYAAGSGLGAATAIYSSVNEVTGTGYTAGGNVVANANPPTTSGTSAYWTPSAAVTWPGLTISITFDCMLLYNQTQGNRAICTLTFVPQTILSGTFTYAIPANALGSALINLN